jgi:hypothetical protein
MKKSFPIAAIALFAWACAIQVPPPQLTTQEIAAPERPGRASSPASSMRGRIDFAGMAKDPHDLEVFVAWLAKVSPVSQPASFPTLESRLAYNINAYNALAMYNTIRSGMPRDLNAVKVRFFYNNRFHLGGRDISLYDFENRVIRPIGDPRVHFALNCASRSCPPLNQEAFEGSKLDAQFEKLARAFVNSDRGSSAGRRTRWPSSCSSGWRSGGTASSRSSPTATSPRSRWARWTTRP